MKSIEQFVFVGLNGYAVALDRDTGEIVWSRSWTLRSVGSTRGSRSRPGRTRRCWCCSTRFRG